MTSTPTDPLDPAVLAAEGHPRRRAVLAVMCLSLVIVVVGNSSLNVALPTLVRQLDASTTELQWIVDAYALVFAGLLLPAGALGDRFGRKGALLGGLVVFGLASFASSFADAPSHLIAGRAVMGLGAAFIMPATLSIISNVFPSHERAGAIATWAGFAGAGAAIGPLSSGFLLEHFSWGSVFLVNVPIVLVAIGLGLAITPTSRNPERSRLDPPGALLSVVGFSSLVFAIIEAPERGWTDPVTLGGFALAAVALGLFVSYELRTATPMLDPRLFLLRGFGLGALTITTAFFALFGTFLLATQLLQFVRGYSPLLAGVATLPMALTMVAVAPRSAVLVRRFGHRHVIAAGLAVAAIGLVLLSTVSAETPYLQLAVALVFMGGGLSLSTPPATEAIVGSLPLSKAGVGSAVNDTTRELGGALGVAVLGTIQASIYRDRVAEAAGGLPAQAAEVVREGVGGALGVATGQGEAGAGLAGASTEAFLHGMGIALLAAAGFLLVVAAVVLRFLHHVERAPEPGAMPPDLEDLEQRAHPEAPDGATARPGHRAADHEASLDDPARPPPPLG